MKTRFSSNKRASETTTGRVSRGAPQQRCRRLGHRHGQRSGRPGQSRFGHDPVVPVQPPRDSPEGCRALADRTRWVLTLAALLACGRGDVDALVTAGSRRSRLETGECARTALCTHELRASRSAEYVFSPQHTYEEPATADLLPRQPLMSFRSR